MQNINDKEWILFLYREDRSLSSNPYSAYKSTQIETASQEQILLMLYDGAIRSMKQARDSMERDDFEAGHEQLIKAQDIITELMASLDMDVGGEVAEDLYGLYEYMLHNLVQANVENEPSRIDDVIPLMESLQESWDEVINQKGMTVQKARRQQRSTPSPEPSSVDSSMDESSSNGSEPSPDEAYSSSSENSSEEPPYGDLSIQG